MLTWLDWWVAGSRDKLATAAPGACPDMPATDLEAARMMVSASVATGLKRTPEDWDHLPPDEQARTTFLRALMPFLFAEDCDAPEGIPPAHGLQPTAELVADLAAAKPPRTDVHRSALRESGWYVDVPHRAVLLDEGTELRAIITNPTPGAATDALVVAVLTAPGKNEIVGRYGWTCGGPPGPAHGNALTAAPEHVREAVDDLLALLLIYRGTAADAAAEELPRVDWRHLARLRRKKQKARQKTRSLFRVVRLGPPPLRFGRTDAERGSGGWRLDHRVPVRGHFRLIHHGPKLAKRRLAWIAAHHRGPTDAAEKIRLERLEKP